MCVCVCVCVFYTVHIFHPDHFQTGNEGAQTSIYLSVAEEVKDESGKYYVDCALAEHKVNPLANDPELAKKLWEVSAELTGVSGDI